MKSMRNKTKAEVRIEQRDGQSIVIKDYSRANLLLRMFYGRLTLKREARTYARLEGIKGIPRCYGMEGKYVLAMEYIPSRLMSKIKRGNIPEEVFEKLDRILSEIHSRGVSITDLHGSNILITDLWDVYIIDFAHALIAGKPEQPGPFVRFFQNLDMHAAARIKARYLNLEKPEPEGIFCIIYKTAKIIKTIIRKIKKL
jgi:predicted Ser/Thr protein kinase